MKTCKLCLIEKPIESFSSHLSTKDRKHSYCKACMKEYLRKHRVETKEKDAKYSKEYREKNKDKLKAKFKDYYSIPENKGKHLKRYATWRNESKIKYKAGQKRWRQQNPEKLAYYTSYHHALRKQAVPNWFSELDLFINQEAHRLRRLRNNSTNILWEVDHIIPIAGKIVCGLHVWNNFQVIPAAKNRSKFNKYELD